MTTKAGLNCLNICLTVLFCFFAVTAASLPAHSSEQTPTVANFPAPEPAHQPGTELTPGLPVTYYLDFFARDLADLPKEGGRSQYPYKEGKPISHLDHQFGRKEVFNSGTGRGVGMRMKGYILFAETGVYELQALSNDGIFFYLGDTLLLKDPKQHSDRLTDIAALTIKTPGWYPVTIEYFQRKGTAALRLFWKKPQNADFTAIPAAHYGHQAEADR